MKKKVIVDIMRMCLSPAHVVIKPVVHSRANRHFTDVIVRITFNFIWNAESSHSLLLYGSAEQKW